MQTLSTFEITTKADLEYCFFYLSDMKNFSEWFPEVLSIREKNKDAIDVGKQYIETVKMPLKGLKDITLTVKSYEKFSLYATEGNLSPLLPRMEVHISDSGDGKTKIKWLFYSRSSSTLFKLVAPMFKKVMNKRSGIASVKLKRILDSHINRDEFAQVL